MSFDESDDVMVDAEGTFCRRMNAASQLRRLFCPGTATAPSRIVYESINFLQFLRLAELY